jgi:hypothetical protein
MVGIDPDLATSDELPVTGRSGHSDAVMDERALHAHHSDEASDD